MMGVVVVVRCLPIRFDAGGIYLVSNESRDVPMSQRLHEHKNHCTSMEHADHITPPFTIGLQRSKSKLGPLVPLPALPLQHCSCPTYVRSCPLLPALSMSHVVVHAAFVDALGAVPSLRSAVLVSDKACDIAVGLECQQAYSSVSTHLL